MRLTPNARAPHLRHCIAAFTLSLLAALLLGTSTACAQAQPPATQPKVGKLPFIEFNVEKRQVRVECEALAVDAPLEFFVCMSGTSEHEAAFRSKAKPSLIHTALLAIGLKPGEPITFLEATKKWLPPHGAPLHMSVEYEKDGKIVSYPANRMIRDIKSKKEPPAFSWIFAGSRITPEGHYGADDTGYTVTLVNFDYALIDVPELASSSNETLEWERNAALMPAKGTKCWLVIEPVGKPAAAGAATQPSSSAIAPVPAFPAAGQPAAAPAGLSDVQVDEQKIKAMIDYHNKVLEPREQALREAAEAHYRVIAELRKEQQRMISEADRVQRAIDQLEKEWNDSVTPRPALEEPSKDPAPPAPAAPAPN